MALTRSNSQVSLSCKLCNGTKNLQWRCMNCKFTICEKCKNIHARIPSTADHNVVTFADISSYNTESRLENLIRNMACQRHPNQMYKYFCQSCEFLVCTHCMFERHSEHQIMEINQFVTKKFANDDHDRQGQNREPNDQENQRNSLTDSGFLDTEPDCLVEDAKNFSFLEESFCLLMKEFKVIHTVTTNLPTISFIKPISSNIAWIGGADSAIISKVDMKKTFITKRKKLSQAKQIDQIEGFQPLDISVNTKEDIMFVCKFDKFLKSVQKNSHGQKQVCDIHNFSPLEPVCIYTAKTGDQNIWVGLTEGGPDFELTEKSTRQVVEMTQAGQICNIFEFTKAGKRLFTLPWRIIDNADTIFVIDRLDQFSGRVVSLNKTGHLMWLYKDPHPCLTQKTFLPTDISMTSAKNIIIVDSANSVLHILNKQGKQILHQSLINLEIEQPFSLSIDNVEKEQHLWIGCFCDPTSKDKKAKIYELDITGI